MSHNIFENDKQQGVEMAWHGLTEVSPKLELANNWLTAWDGVPAELVTKGSLKDTRFSILTATDKPELVIGKPYCPKTYKPVFNVEFLAIAEKLCAKFPGAVPISIGSLRNRARVFVTLQLPAGNGGNFSAGGREFKGLFNLLNSFDQSCPVMGVGSNVCTVCDNTFSANMASGFADEDCSSAIAKHTLGLDLADLTQAMQDSISAQLGFADAFDRLAQRKIDRDTAIFAFAGFVGEKRAALTARSAGIVEELTARFLRGPGNSGETSADWFSAITDYYSHSNAGGEDKAKQWLSSEFGSGAKAKASAWQVINDETKLDALIRAGGDLMRGWEVEKVKRLAEKAKKA